ncbi:cupin domain-containing protein [Halorubrum vacuolatum]|uniref:Cupin domain protein n=1 Tax=Halorubrum vacuolatum TaxID=63740 RepID=A0A238WI43_HALVU|nr:cupin domain-containing protein [Halorubrum vacuolatum]SNR46220.1 Cupin domain protein [Halorubrum vacuolatum]
MARDYVADAIPTVYDLRETPVASTEPGFEQTVFRGVDRMVGLSTIGPEREDKPPHRHPYEQTNIVLEGTIDFIVDGERVSLEPYNAFTIPPEIEHASRAVSDEPCRLLAIWPVREDKLDATDYQTEFHV